MSLRHLMPKTMRFDRQIGWMAIVLLGLALSGCPRAPRLPERAGVGGLLVYDYSGMTVMHQYSDRDYIHMRLHFGWQRPEENSYAAQNLAVEAAFTCGAGAYNPAEFARRLEIAGATMEFLQTTDGPVVLVDCLPEHLKNTWDLLSKCLTDPLFDKLAYHNLRARRVGAQKAIDVDRSQQAMQAAIATAWPELAQSQFGGNAASLDDVARATAQATFTDLMSQRCNLRLITIGPIDAEKISDLLLETVDALPTGACAEVDRVVVPPKLGRVKMLQETRGNEALAGIFTGPVPSSASTVQMRLVMQMLEQRLRTKLVLQDKLATRVEARYVATYPGYNAIQIVGDNAFQCAEWTLSQLRQVRSNGFQTLEVEHAKNAMRSQIGLGYESAPSLAARLDATAAAFVPNLAGNEIPLLDACTAKSCTAMLNQFLSGITWGIVGDTVGVDRNSLQRL